MKSSDHRCRLRRWFSEVQLLWDSLRATSSPHRALLPLWNRRHLCRTRRTLRWILQKTPMIVSFAEVPDGGEKNRHQAPLLRGKSHWLRIHGCITFERCLPSPWITLPVLSCPVFTPLQQSFSVNWQSTDSTRSQGMRSSQKNNYALIIISWTIF